MDGDIRRPDGADDDFLRPAVLVFLCRRSQVQDGRCIDGQGLRADAHRDALADFIVHRPAEPRAECDESGTIQVSGHTDNRPINSGKFKSNWELSTNRGVSIIHLLESFGTINSNQLTAVGYADTRPIFPNDTAEGRSRNRRVEISIIRDGSAGNPIQSIAPPLP